MGAHQMRLGPGKVRLATQHLFTVSIAFLLTGGTDFQAFFIGLDISFGGLGAACGDQGFIEGFFNLETEQRPLP